MEDERNDTGKGAEQEFLSAVSREFLRNSADYMFVKDTDFTHRAASGAVAKMAGFGSSDDIAGKSDYDIFPKKLAENYRVDVEVVPIIAMTADAYSDDIAHARAAYSQSGGARVALGHADELRFRQGMGLVDGSGAHARFPAERT